MEERINIVELLKDCPKGMELDCVCFENVVFDRVDDKNRIRCFVGSQRDEVSFNEYGCLNGSPSAKCVIFPKGETTWEGFVPPCAFDDGDVVITTLGNIAIISNKECEGIYNTYCAAFEYGTFTIGNMCVRPKRLATEEEKQKLFDAIKANGYRWNYKTKDLEELIKPIFKKGNKIKTKGDTRLITIKDVKDDYYIITFPDYFGHCNITDKLSFSNQGDYELVPDKFDITTLKPFESRVLVRASEGAIWKPAIFGYYVGNTKYYALGGLCWMCCIPYEGNEHLLGTTDDCDEYFKTWE